MKAMPPATQRSRIPTPRVADLVWLGLLAGALSVAPGGLRVRSGEIEVDDRFDGASPYLYGEVVLAGSDLSVATLVVAMEHVSPAVAQKECVRLTSAVARSAVRRIWVVGTALHSSVGFECAGDAARSNKALIDGPLAQRLATSLRAHEARLVFLDTTGRAGYSSVDADALQALQDLSPTLVAAKPSYSR